MVPVPAGWRLRAAHGVRITRGGELLVGGSPLRILTLSPRGAELVRGWLAGQPVGEREAERLLARRLLDAGLADPEPPPRASGEGEIGRDAGEVTVVVPVYADSERLARCLAPLAGRCPVIVVDDGSPDGAGLAAVAERYGARYVRHDENRGAAAARNTGLALVTTPFVAFLDADCVPLPGFPERLLDHLADPALGLAAPRIVSIARDGGRIARYERARSALDMGARPALVRPYAFQWYVPSAAMVARREALGAGFDERLELGEDVDLVWRLHDAGWRIRYDPDVAVGHEHRVDPIAWYRRRVAYNESVAPLQRRHPGRVPVLFMSPPAAVAWGAALGGCPASLTALAGVRAARLHRAQGGRIQSAGTWAAAVAVRETAREGRELGRAVAGPWAPCTLVAIAALPGRRRRGVAVRLATLLLTMTMAEWIAERPELGPLTYGGLRLAEESARGVGIWRGCLRARDFKPLWPAPPPPPSKR